VQYACRRLKGTCRLNFEGDKEECLSPSKQPFVFLLPEKNPPGRSNSKLFVDTRLTNHAGFVWLQVQNHEICTCNIRLSKDFELGVFFYTFAAGEPISDFGDKHKLGIILLGMPGFDRRIRNYEQINNQVGFYHDFNTPRTDELKAILEARWLSGSKRAKKYYKPEKLTLSGFTDADFSCFKAFTVQTRVSCQFC
jgi:hypothetical protein